MTNSLSITSAALEEQFARRVAARLEDGSAQLPHDISERLRVARQQAVGQRKLAPQFQTAPSVVSNRGGTATLGGGWWTRIGSVVPLVALVAGLITISVMQEDNRVSELADVDSALLTGDLPTAAYTDPGFAQFLKNEDKASTP
ncbi:MAG: DUF3619 family protein [Variovorax sp.]|nr:MAG: DUF3619 family protein [Variovorax sp.]